MRTPKATETVMDIFNYNKTVKRHEDKLTPMLWGPPGAGKSDIVFQIGESLTWEGQAYTVNDVRLSSLNPVDVRGLPFVNQATGRSEFSLPYFFPQETPTVVFLDEINTAPKINQVTAYEMARNYSVGGKLFPISTMVIMAGNRAEDKGATFDMPEPLKNRMVHITVEPHIEDWTMWATRSGISEEVVSFLNFRPGLLFKPASGKENGFPTPRSWSALSASLSFADDTELHTGIVGGGAAGEFAGFRKLRNQLPNLDQVLATGVSFDTRQLDQSVRYAYIIGLFYRVLTKPELTGNYFKLISDKTLSNEFLVLGWMLVKPVAAIAEQLSNYPEFIKRIQSVRQDLVLV